MNRNAQLVVFNLDASVTNEELRHAIMPATGAHSVSYIYAHFRWSHCDTEGVAFPEA